MSPTIRILVMLLAVIAAVAVMAARLEVPPAIPCGGLNDEARADGSGGTPDLDLREAPLASVRNEAFHAD